MVRFSNLDLLKILKENARTSFLHIAKLFGVSETAIRKRVRRLEEKGVIRRYTIEVDYKKLGFEVQAIIGLDVKPEQLINIIEQLKGLDEVISLYSTSGDHVLIAECLFKNNIELMNFIKKINSMPGVTRVCPAIVVEKIK